MSDMRRVFLLWLLLGGCRLQAPRFGAEEMAGCFAITWQRREGQFPASDFETPAAMRFSPLAQSAREKEPGALALRLEPLLWRTNDPSVPLPVPGQIGIRSPRRPHDSDWAQYYHRRGWHVMSPATMEFELRGRFVGWLVRLKPSGTPSFEGPLDSLRGTGEYLEHERRGGWNRIGRAEVIARRIACPLERPGRSAAG